MFLYEYTIYIVYINKLYAASNCMPKITTKRVFPSYFKIMKKHEAILCCQSPCCIIPIKNT